MTWQYDMVEPSPNILPSRSHFHPRQAPASVPLGISCLADHVHVSSQSARGLDTDSTKGWYTGDTDSAGAQGAGTQSARGYRYLDTDSAGAQGVLKWHLRGFEPHQPAAMTRHAMGCKVGGEGKKWIENKERKGRGGGGLTQRSLASCSRWHRCPCGPLPSSSHSRHPQQTLRGRPRHCADCCLAQSLMRSGDDDWYCSFLRRQTKSRGRRGMGGGARQTSLARSIVAAVHGRERKDTHTSLPNIACTVRAPAHPPFRRRLASLVATPCSSWSEKWPTGVGFLLAKKHTQGPDSSCLLLQQVWMIRALPVEHA
jgi:hypothetical protein